MTPHTPRGSPHAGETQSRMMIDSMGESRIRHKCGLNVRTGLRKFNLAALCAQHKRKNEHAERNP
ncbi:hypothetical protein SBDP1_420006 [Syntrophobacter sp. SbD1]|nr:hypothetical protein SBDP1_420006 [Syntrophobacter sp. SbD1]